MLGSGRISTPEKTGNQLLKEPSRFFFYKKIRNTAAESGERNNHMSEFTAINTQEEFDAAIKSRLERERNTIAKQYEEKLSDYENLKTKCADYDDLKSNLEKLTGEKASLETAAKENADKMQSLNEQLTEANAKVKTFELDQIKTSAAIEAGIPVEFRNRLAGDSEEAIRKDAESLAALFQAQNNKGVPSFEQNEGVPGNSETLKWKKLAKSINNKGE